jgi:hypothetical protein
MSWRFHRVCTAVWLGTVFVPLFPSPVAASRAVKPFAISELAQKPSTSEAAQHDSRKDPRFTWTEEILELPENLESRARKLVLQTNQKLAPDCKTAEVLKVDRKTPLLVEHGPSYDLLHQIEIWDVRGCGQVLSYLVWFTLDDLRQNKRPRIPTGAPRIIAGPLGEAEEFAEKQSVLKMLINYKAR